MNLAADLAADRERFIRLTILQLLTGQPMGNANDAAIYEALNAMDVKCDRDQVRGHLFWMGQQGLIAVLDLRGSNGLVVATLSEKAHDVAKGRSYVPGVARPES